MNSTVHGKEVILLYRHESIQHDLVRERGDFGPQLSSFPFIWSRSLLSSLKNNQSTVKRFLLDEKNGD